MELATVTPDVVNAGFALAAAGVVWVNVYRVWIDRAVRGISFWAGCFFTAQDFWLVTYYGLLGQWWSVTAIASQVLAAVCWVGLAWRFRRD